MEGTEKTRGLTFIVRDAGWGKERDEQERKRVTLRAAPAGEPATPSHAGKVSAFESLG